ncbi:MAG: RpiB/LacA/LacB family sugar-phosphate isomerase [Candidatus Micrarchaeaceae archaeon]
MEAVSDELINSLDMNNVTIVSKEVSADVKSIAKQASSLSSQGRYDLIISIVDNPIGANVALNKYEGLTASVCSDAEDAMDARESGVNVLIVKPENSSNIRDMIAAYRNGKGIMAKIKIPTNQNWIQGNEVQKDAAKQQAVIQKKQLKPTPVQLNKEDPEESQLQSREGVAGWLKDALGIVDLEKPKAKKADAK